MRGVPIKVSRIIDLRIAHFSVTVLAKPNRHVTVRRAGNVVNLQSYGVIVATQQTGRVRIAQCFTLALVTQLTSALPLVSVTHWLSPLFA